MEGKQKHSNYYYKLNFFLKKIIYFNILFLTHKIGTYALNFSK